MPRLSQNPEMLRAARLAKVGPLVWDNWQKCGKEAMVDFKAALLSQQDTIKDDDKKEDTFREVTPC